MNIRVNVCRSPEEGFRQLFQELNVGGAHFLLALEPSQDELRQACLAYPKAQLDAIVRLMYNRTNMLNHSQAFAKILQHQARMRAELQANVVDHWMALNRTQPPYVGKIGDRVADQILLFVMLCTRLNRVCRVLKSINYESELHTAALNDDERQLCNLCCLFSTLMWSNCLWTGGVSGQMLQTTHGCADYIRSSVQTTTEMLLMERFDRSALAESALFALSVAEIGGRLLCDLQQQQQGPMRTGSHFRTNIATAKEILFLNALPIPMYESLRRSAYLPQQEKIVEEDPLVFASVEQDRLVNTGTHPGSRVFRLCLTDSGIGEALWLYQRTGDVSLAWTFNPIDPVNVFAVGQSMVVYGPRDFVVGARIVMGANGHAVVSSSSLFMAPSGEVSLRALCLKTFLDLRQRHGDVPYNLYPLLMRAAVDYCDLRSPKMLSRQINGQKAFAAYLCMASAGLSYTDPTLDLSSLLRGALAPIETVVARNSCQERKDMFASMAQFALLLNDNRPNGILQSNWMVYKIALLQVVNDPSVSMPLEKAESIESFFQLNQMIMPRSVVFALAALPTIEFDGLVQTIATRYLPFLAVAFLKYYSDIECDMDAYSISCQMPRNVACLTLPGKNALPPCPTEAENCNDHLQDGEMDLFISKFGC